MSTREFDAKYTRTLPLRITQAYHGTANEMSNTKRAGTPNLDFLEEKKQVFHLVLFGGAVLQGLVHRAPGKLPSGGTKESPPPAYIAQRQFTTRTRMDAYFST